MRLSLFEMKEETSENESKITVKSAMNDQGMKWMFKRYVCESETRKNFPKILKFNQKNSYTSERESVKCKEKNKILIYESFCMNVVFKWTFVYECFCSETHI